MNPFKRLRSEDVVANAQAEYDSAPPLEPIPTHQATTRDYGSTNEPVIYGDFSTVSLSVPFNETNAAYHGTVDEIYHRAGIER